MSQAERCSASTEYFVVSLCVKRAVIHPWLKTSGFLAPLLKLWCSPN